MRRADRLGLLAAGCAALLAGCAGVRPVPPAPIPPPPLSPLATLSAHAGELGLSADQLDRLEVAERALAGATAEARREVEETLAARTARPQGGREAGAGAEHLGGGRHGGMGDHGGGRGGPAGAGSPGPGRHVASLLRRLEDAEMRAYLDAEAWLPEPLHERCRAVVSRQRELLLGRHDAIRKRLGIEE